MFYILENKVPVKVNDMVEWSNRFDIKNRVVNQLTIKGIFISTVFLGIDHNWLMGPPMLFETMIFGGKDDQYQDRYSTWEEAKIGHARALIRVLKQI